MYARFPFVCCLFAVPQLLFVVIFTNLLICSSEQPDGKEDGSGASRKKARKQVRRVADTGLTSAQQAANEAMRRVLEEDQYSALGSIVDTDSDEEDVYVSRDGHPVRLDRTSLLQAARKLVGTAQKRRNVGGAGSAAGSATGPNPPKSKSPVPDFGESGIDKGDTGADATAKDDARSKDRSDTDAGGSGSASGASSSAKKDHHSYDPLGLEQEEDLDREGSIFGQTTGSSNSTWVECDKCKKWRRLRGVVDEKKLPSKWYCSMNKNDPERARCSAPEEEYEAVHTPESAADARTRKHLRVWVRRLQCQESYEARQPTLTRGKKKAVTSSKEPYEWVRCCNPSCGKWRCLLRIMDAKQQVVDRVTDKEWYCVMNTWDEKMASCAAPQENLPAVGCPPWVMQDDN